MLSALYPLFFVNQVSSYYLSLRQMEFCWNCLLDRLLLSPAFARDTGWVFCHPTYCSSCHNQLRHYPPVLGHLLEGGWLMCHAPQLLSSSSTHMRHDSEKASAMPLAVQQLTKQFLTYCGPQGTLAESVSENNKISNPQSTFISKM